MTALASGVVVVSVDELDARLRRAVADVVGERPAPTALLDGHELARELRCSERQIRRLRALGMPAIRLVESYRYELDACIAWLRAGKGQP